MTQCDKKLIAWQKPDGIFQCALDLGHPGEEHKAPGLIIGQTVSFYDGDRRIFTGEFIECGFPRCWLPEEHNDHNPKHELI